MSKNSKYQTHEKPKRRNWRARCPLARAPGGLKEGFFRIFFKIIVAKHQKIEGWKNIHSVAKYQKKWKGDPLGIFFPKKKSQCRKNWKGGLFSLSRYGMLRGKKEEKPFWFSSLGQMIQFGTIKFCRTFVELFWSVRVDWKKKKKVTIIVAFHFMKRRLKISLKIEFSGMKPKKNKTRTSRSLAQGLKDANSWKKICSERC